MTGTAVAKRGRIASGPCPGCGWMLAYPGQKNATATCPKCGEEVRLTVGWVLFNGNHPCDANCLYAQSPDCSCGCGGANHGAGYLGISSVPEWVRDRDARRHAAKLARKKAKAHRERERAARQLEACLAMIRRDREQDRVESQRQALRAAGVTVPSGRITFVGRVVAVRESSKNVGGRRRWRVSGLVEHADGWAVWGTLPAALVSGRRPEEIRGREVTLTATLEPGRDDPLRGRFSRPMVGAPTRGDRAVPRRTDGAADLAALNRDVSEIFESIGL